MSTARELRGVAFIAVAAFVTLGPFYTQVLLKPGRSADKPWLPMAWQMYHGIGVNMCQAEFSDAAREPLPHEMVQRAVGAPRQMNRTIIKRVRAHDVILVESELPEITRALCVRVPEVRAEVRCSPEMPGGRWRAVHDGTVNLCAKGSQPKAPPVSAEPQPEISD